MFNLIKVVIFLKKTIKLKIKKTTFSNNDDGVVVKLKKKIFKILYFWVIKRHKTVIRLSWIYKMNILKNVQKIIFIGTIYDAC